jgi:tetratricopeptide (TPR) repeat protein
MALTTATPPTIVESLEGALPQGLDAMLGRYDSYVSNPEHEYQTDPERRINGFGYRLLSAKRTKEAILVFETNARRHPESANAFDSLGEAYAKANDKEDAIETYRRSLQLNPKNTNAANVLKQLEGNH